MHLLEVKISGFKSFVDGVTFTIHEGLTGIVGPNGCGKSNILEAIRWVMGANSAKALRGNEMDDVIFAGSDERPQRDIAEVILKIDNSAHTAPDPFRFEDIIEVSRKIRRGLGSNYRINGKEVRAKDVQLLFADASSGANSPALVRQGQVSELINAKPENRRKVLEEASGISGLQARRHEAIIKLNATETNLERISEIIITLQDQVQSLKKQAQKAEKYRGLAGLIRGLQAYLADVRYVGMQASLTQAAQSLRENEIQISDCTLALNRQTRETEAAEAKLPPLRQEMAIAEAILRQLEVKKFAFERDLRDLNEKTSNAQNNLDRNTRDLERETEILGEIDANLTRTADEIAQYEQASSSGDEIAKLDLAASELNAQILTIEEKLNHAIAAKAKNESSLINAQHELKHLEGETQRLEIILQRAHSEMADLSKAQIDPDLINAAQAQYDNAVRQSDNAEAEYNAALAQIQTLEQDEREARNHHDTMQNQANGLRAQIKALNAVLGRDDNKPTSLITQIQVQAGFEKAFAAAIGDDLEAGLKSGDIFWNGAQEHNIIWQDALKDAKTLATIVSAPPELTARLNAVKIVDAAVFNSDILPPLGCRLVTLAGDLKRWDGFIKTRNAPNAQAKRFEQKNHIIALEAELEPIIAQIPALAADLAQRKAALASLRDKTNVARAQHPKLRLEVQNCQKNLNDLTARQTRNNDRLELARENLEQAQSNFQQKTTELNEKTADFTAREAEIKAQNADAQGIISETTNLLNQKRQNFADIRAQINQIKTAEETRKNHLKNLQNQQTNSLERQEKCRARIKELTTEKTRIAQDLQQLLAKPREIEAQKQKTLSEMPLAETRRTKAADNLASAESELRNAQSALRQCETTHTQILTAQSGLVATHQSWLERTQDLKTEILNQFDCDPLDLSDYAKQRLGNLHSNLDAEQAQSRLTRALAEREDLGGVNLNADTELAEQSERAQKLEAERTELMSAVKKLRHAIDEINAEGREKLLQAFDVVNGHFSQLFSTLFNGGQAHLTLTETDDPLGGGLEVYACPPGKRLQSMTLMSGGEQALTATALIFAVFLSNPAPLSVLDEIDAPLDDANVERFCALMDEMRKRTTTKFIVITHHPITMARMDRLFGVTMAQKGVSQLVSVDLSRAETLINAANETV